MEGQRPQQNTGQGKEEYRGEKAGRKCDVEDRLETETGVYILI